MSVLTRGCHTLSLWILDTRAKYLKGGFPTGLSLLSTRYASDLWQARMTAIAAGHNMRYVSWHGISSKQVAGEDRGGEKEVLSLVGLMIAERGR
jgi:hypothetical protein